MKTNGSCIDAPAGRRRVLLVTLIEEIDAGVAEIADHLGVSIEIAGGRAAALRLLERKSYSVVVLDQMLADTDPQGADLLWRHCGLAVPLQTGLPVGGGARLERELRMALARREREQELARLAASAELDTKMKNAVTAFLLESQLALQENGLSPQVEERLRTMSRIADELRSDLQKSTGVSPERGMASSNSPK